MTLQQIYHNVNKTSFYISLIASIGLIVASFIVPPVGVIHPSVLTAVGEIFAFATLGTIMHAILKGSDIKLTHNNTQISLNNPDNKDEKSDNL